MLSPADIQAFLEPGHLQRRLEEIARGHAREHIEVGVTAAGIVQVARVAGGSGGEAPEVFPAGCIAKLLTSELLRQVESTGGVALDRPVSEYLSDETSNLRAVYSRIDLRHLLEHTHGLDDSTVTVAPRLPNGEIDAPRLVRQLVAAAPLFAPGKLYSYSNAGAWLIAAVLEKLAGTSWAALLQDRLLTPLGMRSASDIDPVHEPAAAHVCASRGEQLAVPVTGLLRFLQHVAICRPDAWPYEGCASPHGGTAGTAGERAAVSAGGAARMPAAAGTTWPQRVTWPITDAAAQRAATETEAQGEQRARRMEQAQATGDRPDAASASACERPEIFGLPGWSPFERGIYLGWKSYGRNWFGHHSTWPGASVLVRIRPAHGTALVIASRDQPALLVAARLFGRFLPEFALLKLPQRLTADAIQSMDLGRHEGVYRTAAEAVRVSSASDQGLRMAVDRARRDPAERPETRFATPLQPAAGDVFLPEPGAPDRFPFVQFIERDGGSRRYLWNGRRVWRKRY